MYLHRSKNAFIFLAVHADDMLLDSNPYSRLAEKERSLGRYFKVKDLGEVKFLLRIGVTRDRKVRLHRALAASFEARDQT